MEACGSSHHWAREIRRLGHEVRLIPAFYVKPYVKRSKTDAVDAAAICEAVTRPTMRFVEIKDPEQQALLGLHRVRDLVVRQRTQVINMIRGLLREFGHILPKCAGAAIRFAERCLAGDLPDIPDLAKGLISALCDQLTELCGRISMYSIQTSCGAFSGAPTWPGHNFGRRRGQKLLLALYGSEISQPNPKMEFFNKICQK